MSTEAQNSEFSMLMQQVCGDDPGEARTAFEHLVSIYENRIMAFLETRCKDHHLREDVLQVTFSKAWAKREQFQGDANQYCSWLITIAKSTLIDVLRKPASSKLDRNVDVSWEEQDRKSIPDLARLIKEEELKALRECLDSVGGIFIEALRMQLDGMSGEEIMNQLKKDNPAEPIKIGTVNSRISRGKQQVGDCVRGKLQ